MCNMEQLLKFAVTVTAATLCHYCKGETEVAVYLGSPRTIVCSPGSSSNDSRIIVRALVYAYFSVRNIMVCSVSKRQSCVLHGQCDNGLGRDPVYRNCSGSLSCTIDMSSVETAITGCRGQTSTANSVTVHYSCIPESNMIHLGDHFPRKSYSSGPVYLGYFLAEGRSELRSDCEIQGDGLKLTAVDLHAPGYSPHCGQDKYFVAVWFRMDKSGRRQLKLDSQVKRHYANEVVLGSSNVTSVHLFYAHSQKAGDSCTPVNVWWKVESDFTFNVSCYQTPTSLAPNETNPTPLSQTVSIPSTTTAAFVPDTETSRRGGQNDLRDLLMLNVTTVVPGDTDFPVAVVAGAGVGAVLLMIVIITVIVICFRRSKKQLTENSVRPQQRAGVVNPHYEDPPDSTGAYYTTVYPEPESLEDSMDRFNIDPVKHVDVSPNHDYSEYSTTVPIDSNIHQLSTFQKYQNVPILKASSVHHYDSAAKNSPRQKLSVRGGNIYNRIGSTAQDYDKVNLQTLSGNVTKLDDQGNYSTLYSTTDRQEDQQSASGRRPMDGYELATVIPGSVEQE